MSNNHSSDQDPIINSDGPVIATFNYKPQDDTNVICELNPAQFDGLVKILNKLSTADYININESSLVYNYQGIVVLFDLSKIHKNINLQISNIKNAIRLLKSISGNNNVYIIDDDENSRYIIDNGEIKLFLPKLLTELEDEAFPDLSTATVINQIELDEQQIKKLQTLCKGADHIEYLFDNNNTCKGIYVYEQALYIFPQFINTDISNFNETTAALSLRSTKFPDFDGNKYVLTFLKKDNNDYGLYVKIESFTTIHWYESLQDVTGGNVLM